ncbi:MAG: tetratricopeptide repeat protein, partial [Saprospiraceae bacterium]|nr:tetratricopeptide repeat protein [Saprospiraceae bacterium]
MKLWASNPLTFSILMVLCFSWSASLSQIPDTSFQAQYQKIENLSDSLFLNEGDSLIKDLYRLNIDRNLGNDSLVSGLLLEYFQVKRQRISFEEGLKLIEEIRMQVNAMTNVPYEHLADLHYQLLVAYNHFQILDSSSVHRQLMASYIDSIHGPTPLVLSLAYENAKQAYYQGDFYSQLAFLSNGLDYLNQHFPDRMRTKLNFLNGIGIGYRRTRQYEKAIEHHNQTLAYIKKYGDDGAKEWEGNILNNLGLCHNDLGHYQEA